MLQIGDPRVGDLGVAKTDCNNLALLIPLDLGTEFLQLSNRNPTPDHQQQIPQTFPVRRIQMQST